MEWLIILGSFLFLGGICYIAYHAFVFALWLLKKILNKNKKITYKNNLVKDIKNSHATIVAMLGAGDIGTMVKEVKLELMLA